MKLMSKEELIVCNTFLKTIEDSLQLSKILIDSRCETVPYLYYILKDLLFKIDDPSIESLKDKIEVVLEEFERGSFLITNRGTLDLAWGLGIDTTDTGEIPYDQDTFVYSWTGFMSTLVTQVRLQHSTLLYSPPSTDCPPCSECIGKGDTTSDFENWTSGVYPEDEAYNNCGCSKW